MSRARKAPESLATQLQKLFVGNGRSYGCFIPAKARSPKGKLEGKAWTEREPPTLDLWIKHLRGTQGLGVVPILDDATCRWGAIDIDDYNLDLVALEQEVRELNLPLILCRTKSGGAHLYLFLREAASAELVRGALMNWANALGFPNTEIFPKQNRLADSDDFGNWINMPYYGGDEGERKALRDGDWLGVATFLKVAVKQSLTTDQLQAITFPSDAEDSAVLYGAPPCLVKLARAGVEEGSRNNALFNFGVYLRKRHGLDELQDHIDDINQQFLDPPLKAQEVASVTRSIGKKDYGYRCEDQPIAAVCNRPVCLTRRFGIGPALLDGEAAVVELNKRYAAVMVGGKFAVLAETPGRPVELISQEAATAWFRNKRCLVANSKGKVTPVPIFKYWMENPERREYERIVFDPSGAAPANHYNLFKGYAVQPRKGDCSRFLDHIRDNICQGDGSLLAWIVGWFAALFQEPTRKLGTSLVLRGKQGVGKTIVGRLIGALLGDHYLLVSSPRYVTGQFNSHLFPCLLLHADEAFWAGDQRAEGVLKDLITGEEQLIEFKYKEAIRVRNYVRLLVTTNASWAVPVGLRDRRFAVFDVGDGEIQNHEYFQAMVEQMDHGGSEALLDYLLNYDYTTIPLRTIPKTLAQYDQQLASFTPEEAWLADLLSNGVLPGDWDAQGHSPGPMLFEHYVRGAQKRGVRRRSAEMQLSEFLKKWIPEISQDRFTVTLNPSTGDTAVQRVWLFPPLDACRAAFGQMVDQTIDWGPLTRWEKAPTEAHDVM